MTSLPDLRPSHRPRTPGFVLALALIALLGGLLGACGSDASDSTDGGATTSDEFVPGTEIEGLVRDTPLQVGDQVLPEVARDGTETPFAFAAPPGKLLFAAFGYTNCPDVCPTTFYDIKKALTLMGDDAEKIEVAFGTVDPARDTPDLMNDYLGSFVSGGHALRTEDPEALAAVQDAFGITSSVVEDDEGEIQVSHSAKSFVIDDQGRVVVEWAFGTGHEVMASDLLLLLDQTAS